MLVVRATMIAAGVRTTGEFTPGSLGGAEVYFPKDFYATCVHRHVSGLGWGWEFVPTQETIQELWDAATATFPADHEHPIPDDPGPPPAPPGGDRAAPLLRKQLASVDKTHATLRTAMARVLDAAFDQLHRGVVELGAELKTLRRAFEQHWVTGSDHTTAHTILHLFEDPHRARVLEIPLRELNIHTQTRVGGVVVYRIGAPRYNPLMVAVFLYTRIRYGARDTDRRRSRKPLTPPPPVPGFPTRPRTRCSAAWWTARCLRRRTAR